MWAVFRAAGMARLVLADVVESSEKVAGYRVAVPGADVLVVRHLANRATLEARLRRREAGPELAWYLRRAPELIDFMERAWIGDLLVDTDGRSVGEVAEDVVMRSGWLPAPATPAPGSR